MKKGIQKPNIVQENYNKYVKPHLSKMSKTDDCFKVFNDYSGKTEYKFINQFLLMDENEQLFSKKFKKNVNEVKSNIKQMDKCFERAPVTTDDEMLLWRGMDIDLGLKIGESIVLKNFTSCTINFGKAREFTKKKTHKVTYENIGECCLYAIHVSEGVPYIPLAVYSKFGNIEGEIILPRNLIMTYISEETIGKTGDYKFIPYKTTVKHMKITKLNDEINNNKIIHMSEPSSPPPSHKEEKIEKKNEPSPPPQVKVTTPVQNASPSSYTPQDGKRCKKGTRKINGRCRKPGAAAAIATEKPVPIKENPIPVDASPSSYTPQTGKRCKKGTRKVNGRCRKTDAAEPIPAAAAAADNVAAAVSKCKSDEEVSEKTGKCIKKCPPGKVRNNTTGRCKNA